MQTTTTIHVNPEEVSEKHNERDEELCKNEDHVDLYNEHGQSYHETWYHSDLRDKYQEIFGDAIAEYNAKQKRKDKKIDIDSYMQSVKNDDRGKRQTKMVNGKRVVNEDARRGKQLSYEITAKVGNTYRKKDANGRTIYDADNHHIREEELPRELQEKILKRYCDTFQDANPNFRVVNINYHADEGFYNRKGQWEYSEAHPHIEFIPIAHNFKQGLSVQNSMNKALKEMGFETPNCYALWAKKEQKRLEQITMQEYQAYCATHTQFAQTHGELTIYHPVADKLHAGDKTKEQFAQEQELDEAIHEAESIKRRFHKDVEKVNEKEAELQAQIDAQKALNDKLQAEIEKARSKASEALQTQQAMEQQRKAYADAKAVYEKALKYNEQNAPTSFEEWGKNVEYDCIKMKTVERMTAQGIERRRVPDKVDGNIQIYKVNPLKHYQQVMARKENYQFTEADIATINKANDCDLSL